VQRRRPATHAHFRFQHISVTDTFLNSSVKLMNTFIRPIKTVGQTERQSIYTGKGKGKGKGKDKGKGFPYSTPSVAGLELIPVYRQSACR